MLKRTIKKIRDIPIPESMSGVLVHSALWATSGISDVIEVNPNFKKPNVSKLPDNTLQEGITIYCVHGTGDRVSCFELIANQIISQLPPSVHSIKRVTFNQRYQGISIEDYADQLLKKIQKNGDKNVIVMGHSRGGLVASYFAEFLAQSAGINIHGIFAISTPFAGTYVALGPLAVVSSSIRQMIPNSEFLLSLTEKVRQSENHYHFFSSKNDYVVSSDSSYIPTKKYTNTLLDSDGHLSMMSSETLGLYILDRIIETERSIFLCDLKSGTNDTQLELKSESNVRSQIVTHDIKSMIERQPDELTKSQRQLLFLLKHHIQKKWDDHMVHSLDAVKSVGDLIRICFLEIKKENSELVNIAAQNNSNGYLSTFFKQCTFDVTAFVEQLVHKYRDVLFPTLQTSKQPTVGFSPLVTGLRN